MLQAASSGKYVDACLDMLVSNFSPPFRFIESLKLPYGKVKKEQVLDRVHFALECITDLIPLAPSRLLPIVTHRIHAIYQRTPEPVSSGPHFLFESGFLWPNLSYKFVLWDSIITRMAVKHKLCSVQTFTFLRYLGSS